MKPVFVVTLGDVVGLFASGLVVICALMIGARRWWRVRFCKHDLGVMETQSCNAICKQCGKNLGFIGAWRKAQGENNAD